MARKSIYFNLLLTCSFVAVTSCGSGQSAATAKSSVATATETIYFAVDTSGSAEEARPEIFERAVEELSKVPESSQVFIYRFDSEPAEVYSGPPPDSEEEAAHKLKSALAHSQVSKGTNLRKLFSDISARMGERGDQCRILIFTDCGTEDMADKDLDQCKELSKKWASNSLVTSIEFYGVKPGFRELIRKLVLVGPTKFSFK